MIEREESLKCPCCDSRNTTFYDNTFLCADCNLSGTLNQIATKIGFIYPADFAKNKEMLFQLLSKDVAVAATFSNKSNGMLNSEIINEIINDSDKYIVYGNEGALNPEDDVKEFILSEYGVYAYNYSLYDDNDIDALNKALAKSGVVYLGWIRNSHMNVVQFVFFTGLSEIHERINNTENPEA